MSDLSVVISGYVVGDNLEIRRTITGVASPIAIAWLTVKRYSEEPDDDAIVSKQITIENSPGTGQIVNAGDVGVDGDLRFDLVPDDTRLLGALSWIHDLQIKLDNGTIYTVEIGTIDLTTDIRKTAA